MAISNDVSEDPEGNVAGNYPWYSIWRDALIRPSLATYERISSHPAASWKTGYLWVLLSIVASEMIGAGIFRTWLDDPMRRSIAVYFASMLTIRFGSTILLTVIVFWVARLLGGSTTYSKVMYTYAAFHAPLVIIGSFIGDLSVALLLVEAVLGVVALRAIVRFGWARAVISTVPGFVTLLVVFAVVGVIGAAFSYGEIKGVSISVDAPRTVMKGEEFDLTVRVENSSSTPQLLYDIDVGLITGTAEIEIIQADPEFKDTLLLAPAPGSGFVAYAFQIEIPPGEQIVVRFDAKALTGGHVSGEIDVCVNNTVTCETVAVGQNDN